MFAIVIVFSLSQAVQAIDKPLGYERFTPLTVDSGVFTEKSAMHVFQNYAQPLTIVATKGAVTDKRLIDIETHRDKESNLTLSGVWIENKGDFQQESWLLLDLTSLDIADFYNLLWKEFIPLDIERYDNKQGSLRYALILQRNVHKADWRIHLDVGFQQIRDDSEKYRLVDFDTYSKGFGGPYLYDAIMVRNIHSHYAEWSWEVLPTEWGVSQLSGWPGEVSDFQMLGWQATDVEWVDSDIFALDGTNTLEAQVLLVYSDRDFYVGWLWHESDLSAAESLFGRVIDLEGGPEGTKNFWSKVHDAGYDWHWNVIFCGN